MFSANADTSVLSPWILTSEQGIPIQGSNKIVWIFGVFILVARSRCFIFGFWFVPYIFFLFLNRREAMGGTGWVVLQPSSGNQCGIKQKQSQNDQNERIHHLLGLSLEVVWICSTDSLFGSWWDQRTHVFQWS